MNNNEHQIGETFTFQLNDDMSEEVKANLLEYLKKEFGPIIVEMFEIFGVDLSMETYMTEELHNYLNNN